MTAITFKLGLFSGLTFIWLKLGEYLHQTKLLSDPVIAVVVIALLTFSMLMAYQAYSQLKELKSAKTREKYFIAARSGNFSKLRRLIISNPIEASRYVKIKYSHGS